MRFGLTAIKNVGEGAIESLLNGPHQAQGRIASLARSARISICGSSTSACSRVRPRLYAFDSLARDTRDGGVPTGAAAGSRRGRRGLRIGRARSGIAIKDRGPVRSERRRSGRRWPTGV